MREVVIFFVHLIVTVFRLARPTFSESGHCRDPPGHAFVSRVPSRDGRQVHSKGIVVKTVSKMRQNSAFCASPIVQRHL